MKFEMLPIEGQDKKFSVIACVNDEGTICWAYSQVMPPRQKNPVEAAVPTHGELSFIVTRSAILGTGPTSIFVEDCGWSPYFRFRLEMTTNQPEEAVRCAVAAVEAME